MRAGKEVRLKMTHGEDKACKERESRSCPPPQCIFKQTRDNRRAYKSQKSCGADKSP